MFVRDKLTVGRIAKLRKDLKKLGVRVYDSSEPLYKYVDMKTALLILESSTLMYQHYAKFNDPLDPHFDALDLMSQGASHIDRYDSALPPYMISEFLRDAEEQFNQVKRTALDNLGILCLSRNFSNVLMWSHYSEKHTGVCLGFRNLQDNSTDNLDTFSVKYSDKVTPVPFYFNQKDHDFSPVINFICTKASIWKYEEEVRVIKYLSHGVYPFDRGQLCEIYFGVNSSQRDVQKIISLLKAGDYLLEKVGQMKAKKLRYELDVHYLNQR